MPVPVFTSGEILTAANMNQVGLWLIKTQTIGSAVSSVTVSDVFSSSFDNYLITVNGGASSSNGVLRLQFGSTTSGYYYQLLFAAWGSTPLAEGSSVLTYINSVGASLTNGLQMFCQVFNPNTATRTTVQAQNIRTSEAGTTFGLLDNTTQYTGFNILASAGTLTGGTIRVYGYRN
jgi:hypothetical protein